MDQAYVTALAALAGSVIGGATSFGSSWITQRSQTRAQFLQRERASREELYGKFIDTAAKLYGDALRNGHEDVEGIVALFAMLSRMRLHASPTITTAGEKVITLIADAYRAPNLTTDDLHVLLHAAQLDPLGPFSAACRAELLGLGA
jgi:hypothetical protein